MGRQFAGDGNQSISLLYVLLVAFSGLLGEGQAGPSRPMGVVGDFGSNFPAEPARGC